MKASTKLEFLSQFPLFDVLSEDELNYLHNATEIKSYQKYDQIYVDGDHSDTIFFLTKGVVKLASHGDDGREVIKAILHPHTMFGELGILGEERRQGFAEIMNEPAECLLLRVKDSQYLMGKNHQLCFNVINMVGKKLRKTEQRLESLIFKDARARIIDFLKDSVEKRGRKVGFEMLLKHSLTQQDIANITGTSRQTVTSVLNDLRKSDLIYFNRRSILIRDMQKLA
ncbi:MAG: Crp/Fnr family transcriptional regulator [Bacteroidota bacterium]